MEITSLFNGESDDRNAIVSIHPGAGGTESADWTTMLYDMYRKWISEEKLEFKLLDYLPGDEAGIKSVTFFCVRSIRIWEIEGRNWSSSSCKNFSF